MGLAARVARAFCHERPKHEDDEEERLKQSERFEAAVVDNLDLDRIESGRRRLGLADAREPLNDG